MATVSGQGTSFNLPNYTGELHSIAQSETPFLSAIGGLTGGKSSTATKFEWQTEDLETTSANDGALEGANAPAASGVSRSNVWNVCEIHQEAVEVSYTKQAATGLRNGLNVDGSNPVQDELQHQIDLKLAKIGVDVEKSFLLGTRDDPANNSTPRKTQGVLGAITSNVETAATLSKPVVDALLIKMFGNGAKLPQDRTVFLVNAAAKVALTNVYAAAGLNQPTESRNVGGVNITQLVTDFGTFGVMLDRWMPADTIAVVDLSVCAPVYLSIPNKGHLFAEPLAKTGSADKYQIYGEIGLEYGPQSYHGKITGLSFGSSSSSSSSSS